MAAQDLRPFAAAPDDLSDAVQRCVYFDVPELLRLARTLDAWTEGLLPYFTTGEVSNEPTEAMNLLIKPSNE